MPAVKAATLAAFNALASVAGIKGNVIRGAQVHEVTLIPGNSTYEVDGDEVAETYRSVDWLCLVADYPYELPERGDIVTDAGGVEYSVRAPVGTRHYEYSDPYEQVFRIHTVRV